MNRKMIGKQVLKETIKINIGAMFILAFFVLTGVMDTVSFFLFYALLVISANIGMILGYIAVTNKNKKESIH